MKYLLLITSLLGGFGCAFRKTDCVVDIAQALVDGRVAYAEIYLLPENFITFVAVTPEHIRQIVEPIRMDSSSRLASELAAVLRRGVCRSTDRLPDVRIAILFFDENGRELHALFAGEPYLLNLGTVVLVDGKSLKLWSNLQKWTQSVRHTHGAAVLSQ